MNNETIKKLLNIYSELETKLLDEIVEHFKINEEFINSDYWRVTKLEELGVLNNNIIKYIAEVMNKTPEEIKEALKTVGYKVLNINRLNEAYNGGLLKVNPSILTENQVIENLINYSYNELTNRFLDISNKIEQGTRDAYLNVVEKAYIQTSEGITYQDAIRNALLELGDKGITTLTYKTVDEDGNVVGIRNYDVEGAIRRELVTATHNLTNNINQAVADELKVEYLYLSEHLKCRPQHFPWQGTIIKREDLVKVTGLGKVDGMGGPNCKHYPTPYFGTARGKELKKISLEEATKQYELSQKQRYLERGIRKWKRKQRLFKAVEDKEYYEKCKNKVKEWQLRNKEFTEKNNLRRDFSRENVEKLTSINKNNILKANNNNDKIYSSKITRLEKISDLSDKTKTEVLEKYEKQIMNKDVENAVVIDSTGQTYLLEGDSSNSIYIKNLEDKLKDSYMTHNHPKNETYYSLSAFDISEFMETEMQKLRGVDYKYVYEIERTKNTIKVDRDTILHEFSNKYRNEALEIIRDLKLDIDEDEYHIINKLMAKKYKYKYRRYKNDQNGV